MLAGVAMAGILYPPAFAALTRWGGDRRVGALTTLTLVAGLASTVFAPLASGLDDWLGWRDAYLVLLVVLVAHHGPAALVGAAPPVALATPDTEARPGRVGHARRPRCARCVRSRPVPAAGRGDAADVAVDLRGRSSTWSRCSSSRA